MVSIFHLKYQFRTVLTTMFREERYTVSMFPTEFYTIWWLDDFDIRKCAVGRINDTRYRNCFHAAQVLIGLPYFRHVLIDRLICNLFANIYCFNVEFTWVGVEKVCCHIIIRQDYHVFNYYSLFLYQRQIFMIIQNNRKYKLFDW